MQELYANLIGNWTNLSDLSERTDVIIDNSYRNIPMWIEDMLPSLNEYDYINISVEDVNYRIHPSQIQIVTR